MIFCFYFILMVLTVLFYLSIVPCTSIVVVKSVQICGAEMSDFAVVGSPLCHSPLILTLDTSPYPNIQFGLAPMLEQQDAVINLGMGAL